MSGVINTDAIMVDINPTHRRADRRFKGLPADAFAAFHELLEDAVILNATTGSEYTDGEFPLSRVMKGADYINFSTLKILEEAELIWPVEGDRWAIDFHGQTSHETLQNRADGYAKGNETRRAAHELKKAQQAEAEEKVAVKREQSAARSKAYRERKLKLAEDFTVAWDDDIPDEPLDFEPPPDFAYETIPPVEEAEAGSSSTEGKPAAVIEAEPERFPAFSEPTEVAPEPTIACRKCGTDEYTLLDGLCARGGDVCCYGQFLKEHAASKWTLGVDKWLAKELEVAV